MFPGSCTINQVSLLFQFEILVIHSYLNNFKIQINFFLSLHSVVQVECILSALPEPTETDIKSVGNGFGSVLLNQSTKSSSSNPSMDELLADSPTDAKHLIKSLLVLDPTKRLTAKQAMCHRYVEK